MNGRPQIPRAVAPQVLEGGERVHCRYCGAPVLLVERYARVITWDLATDRPHREVCQEARRAKRIRQRERTKQRLVAGLREALFRADV